MLSQKLAALLALIVLASQGAMAAPSSRSSVVGSVVATGSSALGGISAATLPDHLVKVKAAVQADEGEAPADDDQGGDVDGLFEDGTAGSYGGIVVPAIGGGPRPPPKASNKVAEDYNRYVNNHLFSIPLLLTFFLSFFFRANEHHSMSSD